ncbi:MAG: acyl-CoA thioester hydrolase, partial [Saprospiraceae bacterium]
MKELLKEFPAITEIKVRWGEMDAANHVNNVMYFRWAETARFEYFEK